MTEIIYNGPAQKESNVQGYALLWGFALVGLVYAAVVFYFGDTVSDGMRGSLPFVVLASIVFIVWGIYKYSRSKSRLEIVRTGENNYSIQVTSPDKEAVVQHAGQVKIEYGWQKVYVPKASYMKHLYLAFFDNGGKNVLTLKFVLGTIHSVPLGWPELANEQLIRYDNQYIYVCNGWQKIVDHFVNQK